MSDTHRENAILQAIDIIADKKISQASFDKTIKAVVKEEKDATTGEYLIKYQDSEFIAYATSSQVHYQQGEQVYILIPGNDFMGVKRIIGSSNNKAIEYQEIPVSKNLYNKLGTNIVSLTGDTIQLSSYGSLDEETQTAIPEDIVVIENIKIDTKAIKNYVRTGNSLAIGMTVKTTLASSQVNGWYGVIFTLKFKNNEIIQQENESLEDWEQRQWDNAATRSYIVSSKDIIGNPYALTKQTFVETLITRDDIDVTNLLGIESVTAFCEGFPTDKDKINIKDIFISEIYLSGATTLTDSELNGYLLNIDYSETGNILDDDIQEVKLKAELKIKGKVTTQDINYYWFRENGTIFKNSPKYFSKAGDGWECLNSYVNKTPVPFKDNGFSVFGSSENLPIAATACLQKNTNIRCVAIYDNNAFIADCKVINLNLQDIKIESSDKIGNENKTVYYLDNGSPTLTCNVYAPLTDDLYIPQEGYQLVYKWSIITASGKGQEIDPNPIDQQVLREKEELLNSVELMDEVSRNAFIQTDGYKEAVKFIQKKELPRVEDNIYYNFPISIIQDSGRVCCAVYKENSETSKYLGTGSITFENKAVLEGQYTLTIDNGTQVFQYDGKGNSPTSNQLEKPLILKPLSFTLLDNNGTNISYNNIINNGQVKWIYPNTQTLIIDKNDITPITGDLDFSTVRAAKDLPLDWKEYNVINNVEYFKYDIAESYNLQKNINYIWLNVKYKNMIFNAYTNFTFPKDGDPGTNGTDFIAKVYSSNTERLYLSNNHSTSPFNDNGEDGVKTNLIFELYNNGNLIPSSEYSSVTWECPIKKNETGINKNTLCSYVSNGTVKLLNNLFSFPNSTNSVQSALDYILDKKPVNIIRAKVLLGEIKYYAEYPINCQYFNVETELYRIKIAPRTGFKYVVYAQDGTSPNYDNTVPFRPIFERKIGGYWIQETSNLNFEWSSIGNLSIEQVNADGTCIVKPFDNFDGLDLFNALICKVYWNNDLIGFIHIPIYMILNRYGHQALNDWDGNSIQLNGVGNTILAPQIGAGKKEDDNSFTGVFMGTINGLEKAEQDQKEEKIPNKGFDTDQYKIGFAGYNKGQRTIFLDSKTGKAQFGKNNAGKIILDPNKKLGGRDSALIYSGNYPIDQFLELEDVENVGNQLFDKDGKLTTDPEKGKRRIDGGMIIDLSTPQIGFGSGNFTVNQQGHIVAKGGGQIAGWSITDNKLHKNNKVGMASSKETVPTNTSSLKNGDTDTVAFWAGGTLNDNGILKSANFYATHGGYLFSKLGQIAGWDFNSQRLAKDSVGMNSDPTNISYILSKWPDGKTHKAKAFFANGDNFYVTHDGYLKSQSGKIASWDISSTALTNNKAGMGELTLTQKDHSVKTYFGTEGNVAARFWSLDNKGKASFAVDDKGNLYSRAGKIGGWTINQTNLRAGNTVINSNGNITVEGKWAINSNGSVKFTDGTIGGIKISADKIGSAKGTWYISDSSIKIPFLKVNENNITYKVTDSGTNGTISGDGVKISGSSGNSLLALDKVKDMDDTGKTLNKKIKQIIAEALGAKQLRIYSSLEPSSDGKSWKTGNVVIYLDNKNAAFMVPIIPASGIKPARNFSYYGLGRTKNYTIHFNNDTYIGVRNGIIFEAKGINKKVVRES